MKINPLKVIADGKNVKISCFIEYGDSKKELWYCLDQEYQDFLTVDKLDGFLVGLLLLAMKHKEDIYIDGAISEKLFYNLTNYFIKIVTLLIPSLHPIKIFPKELHNGKNSETVGGVVTGFSGGIDSFCVLIDHLYNYVPQSYKITHLVLNNVGSHGEGGRDLFNKRYQRLLSFAHESQLPFIKIDSNLDDILSMEFRNTHTTRNVSAILILQKLFGKYLYASAHKYQNCFIGESPDASVIDPSAIHLLSTETTECISTGCQYSRVEKTIKVAELEPSYRYLDVCVHAVDAAENCSTCWKCARTLLTLEIIGKHTLYHQVFDLNKFAQIKGDYISSIIDKQTPLEQEVIQLAAQRHYKLIRS